MGPTCLCSVVAEDAMLTFHRVVAVAVGEVGCLPFLRPMRWREITGMIQSSLNLEVKKLCSYTLIYKRYLLDLRNVLQSD
jgi:hypothetical protein